MSSSRNETRKALASKQEQLNLQQLEAAADKSTLKSNPKASGGSFLARIKAAPPLVVATASDDEEEPPTEHDEDDPPAAAPRPGSSLDQLTGRASPSVVQQTTARPNTSASQGLSLTAAPRPVSPSQPSHARPTGPLDHSSSHAAAAPAAPPAQHPPSDSDALSYVDIDSDYVAEPAKPVQVDPRDSLTNEGGQLASRRESGAKKGPWWSAEGLSPQQGSSALRSTARGKDAQFTFYEDAPRATVFGQPVQQSPPRSHPPASRPQPRPSPLRLEQPQEAQRPPQRPPRRRPQKSLLSNNEVTRPLDHEALLASFRTADEAIKARPRAAPSARREERAVSVVYEEVQDEEPNAVVTSEEGEEDLPDPAELKKQATSAPRDKDRKGKGAATTDEVSPKATTKTKRKPRPQEQLASDCQPDDFDTPPHLADFTRPRRQTRTSTTTPNANRSIDSTSGPSSDTEAEEAPVKGKRKSGAGGKAKAKGKGKGKATNKKDSPPVDTQSLLAMLPRRKRKIEVELTDSGEEPEDEEDELDSDVDEIGYRAKKKRSTSSKAKASTSTNAKTYNRSKSKKAKTGGRGKKAAVKKDEEPDSEKECAKQNRITRLKETDDYKLDVMVVL